MNTQLLGVRNVKYRPLTDLVGRTITITSFRTLEIEVLNAIGPMPGRFIHVTHQRTLAKGLGVYGYLDLDFEAQDFLTRRDAVTRTALRELGFFDKEKRTAAEKMGCTSDPTCLSSLIEGMDPEKTFLKLFMTSETGLQSVNRVMEKFKLQPADDDSQRMDHAIARLIDEAESRLPREFVIEDACLTNSSFIWLHRHLWL